MSWLADILEEYNNPWRTMSVDELWATFMDDDNLVAQKYAEDEIKRRLYDDEKMARLRATSYKQIETKEPDYNEHQ